MKGRLEFNRFPTTAHITVYDFNGAPIACGWIPWDFIDRSEQSSMPLHGWLECGHSSHVSKEGS